MHTSLPHTKVLAAIASVLTGAEQDGLAPVCMALFSPHGHLVHFVRMANAPDRAINIALDKAKTAALMGVSTRDMYERLHSEGLNHIDFGGALLCAITGGVPVYNGLTLMGGVGVSGRTPDADEKLALHCAALLQKAAQQG